MNEDTVTIKKLWPPFKPGDKRTNLETTNGDKYRIDVGYCGGFQDGQTVEIGWTDERNSPEFGGREYKLIKKMQLVATKGGYLNDLARGQSNGAAAAPRAVDVGPHRAMWEKEISRLIENGMPEEQVPVHVITCRRLAREGLAADIDGKLPEPKAEFNDSLEY